MNLTLNGQELRGYQKVEMTTPTWDQSAITGMQQGIVFASAFFSCVASTRELLPSSCFANVIIGKSNVAGLKIPTDRFASPTHKGLYAWIANDLRVALSTMRDFTASLIVDNEVFQIHAVRENGHVQTDDELCTSVRNVIRALDLWIENGDWDSNSSTSINLDIAKGFVRFGKYVENEDSEFDKDIKMKHSDLGDKLESLDRCVDLGTVKTSTLVLNCLYYCHE